MTLDALVPYGWNERWAASFAPFDHDGGEPARVLRHDGAGLIVATADGVGPVPLVERVVPAPAVGDWVVIRGGRPVSYTHLDVYKRQPAHCSMGAP